MWYNQAFWLYESLACFSHAKRITIMHVCVIRCHYEMVPLEDGRCCTFACCESDVVCRRVDRTISAMLKTMCKCHLAAFHRQFWACIPIWRVTGTLWRQTIVLTPRQSHHQPHYEMLPTTSPYLGNGSITTWYQSTSKHLFVYPKDYTYMYATFVFNELLHPCNWSSFCEIVLITPV